MRDLRVAEQRYKAILALIGDGRTVTDVAAEWAGEQADRAHMAGALRGRWSGGVGRPIPSSGDLPASAVE